MQSRTTFVQGDLVQLKRGGPVMSVHLPVGPLLLCTWFEGDGRMKRGTFSPSELEAPFSSAPIWVKAIMTLSSRCKLVAATC